jgi:LuxR family transcriptional regulator, regulator of acetate metabolism
VHSGDDADAIRAVLPALRRATGLPIVFGAYTTDRRTLRITELLGTHTDSLRGLSVKPGFGLGGKVMLMGRPLWVGDYLRAVSISHDYDGPVSAEGMLSTLAVPVIVGGQVRGVLYGGLRQEMPLGDRTLVAAVSAARDLEQELAVRDAARRNLAALELARRPTQEAARWEEIRFLHAELRSLAGQVTDEDLRERLLHACGRLAGTASQGVAPGPVPALSPRELDVLACVAIGHTNAAAAHQLGLLPETVKSYLRSAMRKLGSRTRLEAVAVARRSGLLP